MFKNYRLPLLDRLVARSLDWDFYVLGMTYKGERRVVSPIRWKSRDLLLAFCLRDGRPKHFLRKGICDPELIDSSQAHVATAEGNGDEPN
jgi:hypothetical protein